MINEIVKFSAHLILKTEIDGGRRTPIKNGYITDLKFKDSYRIVAIEFDKNLLFPGEASSIVCHILLHGEDEINYLLEFPQTFISDGPNIIGHIEINNIINKEN